MASPDLCQFLRFTHLALLIFLNLLAVPAVTLDPNITTPPRMMSSYERGTANQPVDADNHRAHL